MFQLLVPITKLNELKPSNRRGRLRNRRGVHGGLRVGKRVYQLRLLTPRPPAHAQWCERYATEINILFVPLLFKIVDFFKM